MLIIPDNPFKVKCKVCNSDITVANPMEFTRSGHEIIYKTYCGKCKALTLVHFVILGTQFVKDKSKRYKKIRTHPLMKCQICKQGLHVNVAGDGYTTDRGYEHDLFGCNFKKEEK